MAIRVTEQAEIEPYRLRISRSARQALGERLKEKVATAAYEFITVTLLENPRRMGKPLLLPPFVGTYSTRRGTYRVLYEIDEKERVVLVTAVERRADAYRSR